MGVEIERKFLVRDTAFLSGREAERLVQGYLANTELASVRIRIAGPRAFLTIKGRTTGICREEFEYPIPLADAEQMLGRLTQGSVIDKFRYRVPLGGHTWEVDVFAGENAGLVIAEIELESESAAFEKPAWLGAEVSLDPRYLNANLVTNPYSRWSSG